MNSLSEFKTLRVSPRNGCFSDYSVLRLRKATPEEHVRSGVVKSLQAIYRLIPLALLLLIGDAHGAPPAPGDDSPRARLKACLLLGDLQCVVAQYLLLQGTNRAPDWLVIFQNSFSIANRRAGRCIEVARNIHLGLSRLGQRPEYVRVTVEGDSRLLGFDELIDGVLVRTHQVATTGYHIAVKLGDRVLDAYTGPAGLKLSEYTQRLITSPGSRLVIELVEEP